MLHVIKCPNSHWDKERPVRAHHGKVHVADIHLRKSGSVKYYIYHILSPSGSFSFQSDGGIRSILLASVFDHRQTWRTEGQWTKWRWLNFEVDINWQWQCTSLSRGILGIHGIGRHPHCHFDATSKDPCHSCRNHHLSCKESSYCTSFDCDLQTYTIHQIPWHIMRLTYYTNNLTSNVAIVC